MTRPVLQLCPHDSAPFGMLCELYAQAARRAGFAMTSVFLGPPTGEPLAYAQYLNLNDLTSVADTRERLAPWLASPWRWVLCHRYRAYWAVRACRGDLSACVVLAHEYGLLSRWQRRLGRLLYGRRSRFAGVAPDIAAELAAVTGSALVLPNVLDVNRSLDALLPAEAALRVLQLTPGPTIVGVVGRLHYKKRPQLAIDAFRKYADDIDPTARLVFIGAGELRDALADPDMEAVVFQGVVPEAARTFGAFDVLLHTASAEPFGMVILEAMIAGVPVVVRSGHGPEYILGDLGFYASDDTAAGYAAALARAVAADRLELARQGLERARSIFSVDALARELERL